MILVDTSIWIDHLRRSDREVSELLHSREVLVHPFVVGELAVGHLGPKATFLRFLQKLPEPVLARHADVLDLIAAQSLFGLGLGYIDTHLLASVLLTPGSRLWTRDKRLRRVANTMKISAPLV